MSKKFLYPLPIRLTKWYAETVIIAFSLLLVYLLGITILPVNSFSNHSVEDKISRLIFITLFILGHIYLGSNWPSVIVDDKGMKIEFFWFWLTVRWDEVLEIQKIPMRIIPPRYFIRIKGLTIFHRVIGFTNIATLEPGFLIHSRMIDCAELIKIIETQKNSRRLG